MSAKYEYHLISSNKDNLKIVTVLIAIINYSISRDYYGLINLIIDSAILSIMMLKKLNKRELKITANLLPLMLSYNIIKS